MSSYEDYQRTSRHYDSTRKPVASDRVLGWLARHEPIDGLEVLDAGCGTGQFSAVLLPHVARVVGLDLNPGMLAVARAKFEGEPRVSLHRGSIEELPFDDDQFDGAVINQVLHHLPDDDAWSRHRRVFSELRRVLRPGASFVLNTCSEAQIRRGYWYTELMPTRVLDSMVARYAPLPVVEELLRAVGFDEVERWAPLHGLTQPERYHEPRGPLDPVWRDGDSTWALLTDAELEAAMTTVRRLDDAGELEGWMRQADARRPDVGQITLLAAR